MKSLFKAINIIFCIIGWVWCTVWVWSHVVNPAMGVVNGAISKVGGAR